jgi:ribonuclease HII
VIAKVIRDNRFHQIRQRYEPEFGPIAGGGYGNAATRKWVRAYVEKYGKLPDEARLSWPYPFVADLLGTVRPLTSQINLFA